VAKMLSQRLGFVHLNSGLLYRAIAYALVHQFNYTEIDLRDPKQSDLDAIVCSGDLVYQDVDGEAQVWYAGQNLTPGLKTREMDNWASISSANSKVRASLMTIQRAIGLDHNVVAEGRDTGTKIFPQADLKLFLTASLAVRAGRWQQFMRAKGSEYTLEQCMQMVDERDQRDIHRTVAPLVVASDAIEIDNSNLDLNQTVDLIMTYLSL
jgi:CMP/dCMP kinase